MLKSKSRQVFKKMTLSLVMSKKIQSPILYIQMPLSSIENKFFNCPQHVHTPIGIQVVVRGLSFPPGRIVRELGDEHAWQFS